jgi:DNA-directed RNA polymerase subunit L
MNAQVISSEPKEISPSNIDFAGVIVKHPLTNECWMRINSSSKPLGEIKKATDSAIKMAEEFKQLFNSKIKVN